MIDRLTVEKIKDASNIVDVVSEFVTLRKSGSNYKGLCPFHNEKTPSFYVSPARGTCHCFGCGKGGNPISFIMEHEQMTYPEALRWLANKYNIEIHERELSDQEKEEQKKVCHEEDLTLIQGIIDVFWIEKDGIVLLDYKTDRVQQAKELIDRYETQLKLYADVLERVFGARKLKVKEILIYSFSLEKLITL